MADPIFSLPVTAPPVPAVLYVPAHWRRVDDLDALGLLPRPRLPGAPWLLVESPPSRPVPVPGELFLRHLYPLDPNDVDAVVAWCGRWGVPHLPAVLRRSDRTMALDQLVEGLADAPGVDAPAGDTTGPVPLAMVTRAPDADDPDADKRLPLRIGALLRALQRAATRTGADVDLTGWTYSAPGGPRLTPIPAAAASFAVAVFRALVGFFAALPKDHTGEALRVLDADFLSELWRPAGVPDNLLRHPDGLLDALYTAVTLLNDAVAKAAPWAVGLYAGSEPVLARRTLVGDVIALEIAAHLYDAEPVRHCALDGCGRLFVHQIGRAKKGGRRTLGVKYCSPECAHTAAQRDYRRRAAGARGV